MSGCHPSMGSYMASTVKRLGEDRFFFGAFVVFSAIMLFFV